MNKKSLRNIPASVKGRLLQLSKLRQEDFNYLLTRYAADRLLYRLSQSPYKQQFILKGASLFRIWHGEPHRATKDLDLLGYGENEISYLEKVFAEICCIAFEDDGIVFDQESVKGEKIKEEQEYEGVRIKLTGKLTSINIQVQVDIDLVMQLHHQLKKLNFLLSWICLLPLCLSILVKQLLLKNFKQWLTLASQTVD